MIQITVKRRVAGVIVVQTLQQDDKQGRVTQQHANKSEQKLQNCESVT